MLVTWEPCWSFPLFTMDTVPLILCLMRGAFSTSKKVAWSPYSLLIINRRENLFNKGCKKKKKSDADADDWPVDRLSTTAGTSGIPGLHNEVSLKRRQTHCYVFMTFLPFQSWMDKSGKHSIFNRAFNRTVKFLKIKIKN